MWKIRFAKRAPVPPHSQQKARRLILNATWQGYRAGSKSVEPLTLMMQSHIGWFQKLTFLQNVTHELPPPSAAFSKIYATIGCYVSACHGASPCRYACCFNLNPSKSVSAASRPCATGISKSKPVKSTF